MYADSDDKPTVRLSVSISAECFCRRSLSFPNYEKPYAETSVSTPFHYKLVQMLPVIICSSVFNQVIFVRRDPSRTWTLSRLLNLVCFTFLPILVYFKMLWYSNPLCMYFVFCVWLFIRHLHGRPGSPASRKAIRKSTISLLF